MIDAEAVRAIAMSLSQAEDRSRPDSLSFSVGGKQFAWSWQERVAERAPRRPRLDVLAVRCPAPMKDILLEAEPELFFTEDHYRGFPAVLVRLEAIDADRLRALLVQAWRCQAPRELAKRLEAR